MTQAPEPGYAFRGPGLDRAEQLRDDPEQLQARWPSARVVVVDADGHLRFPGSAEAPEALHGRDLGGTMPADASFLGLSEDGAWFALPHESLAEPLSGRLDLRTAALEWPLLEVAAAAEARALLHWRSRKRHCGGCGERLSLLRAGWQAHCGHCGLEYHPRTDPAVIVAVSDGSRLLLGRQPGWAPRRYSTLAGFVEPGETLEQTVAREVFEESAVRVRGCRYLASQPWPFPSSLMLGFFAEAEPDTPLAADDELEDVRWFDRDQVGAALRDENSASGLLLSPKLSISRWLIERWYAGTDAGAPA